MENKTLTNAEKKILRVVYHHTKHGIPLSLYEIAKKTGYTYPTVKKYVNKLIKEKILYE